MDPIGAKHNTTSDSSLSCLKTLALLNELDSPNVQAASYRRWNLDFLFEPSKIDVDFQLKRDFNDFQVEF